MKKIFKKEVIIAFIIGIILASSIAVYAATINAKDVDYKDGKTVEYALSDLYSNLNATLLWTNSSPSSNFNGQTLSLDLSNYKYVVIITKAAINDEYFYRTSTILPIGNSAFSQHVGATGTNMNREVKAFATGIEFSSANNNDNSFVIPLKIYGIKSDFGMWNDIIGE